MGPVRVALMVTSRSERRSARRGRAESEFGSEADAVLDILELVEFAWHDCFGEVSPPDQVIDDVFFVAGGNTARFARAARLAVEDFRDLRLSVDDSRK